MGTPRRTTKKRQDEAPRENAKAAEQPDPGRQDKVTLPVAGLSPAASTPRSDEADRGARLIREAAASRAGVVEGWKKLLESLGIHGQPIGAKKLRERLLAEGVDPDDNAFSREIIAMREE